jgi:hypothetical protein
MQWVRRIISHSGGPKGDWYYFPPNSTVRFRSTSEVRHALTGSDEFSAANCSAAAATIGAKMEDFHADRKEMKYAGPLKGGMGAHGADRSNPYLAFMDAELKKLHAENSLLPKAERMDPQSIMRRAAKHYRARGGAVGGAAGAGGAAPDDAKGKDVGRRLGIWWPDDQIFYMGRVLEQKRGRSLVLYDDDNVQEWLHLDREVTKWEDGLPGPGKPLVRKPKPPLAQVPAEAPSAKRTKLASWSPPTDVPIWLSAARLLGGVERRCC